MASSSFDTKHGDIVHDVQMDYYGKRVATCSSDRTIGIFDVSGQEPTRTAQLMGHNGPVWQVAWAHPQFGNILASCSYDKRIIVWKEVQPNQWAQIFTYEHKSSVNSIAWAPHEYDLVLAAACADGAVSVHMYNKGNETWDSTFKNEHGNGANSVSWAPCTYAESKSKQFFVSAGFDHRIVVWKREKTEWVPIHSFGQEHKSYIRSVAWAPNLGLPGFTVASCAQDGSVFVWKTSDTNGATGWKPTVISHPRKEPAWSVSWSLTGNMLAVASGENQVQLYKESPADSWTSVSVLSETSQAPSADAPNTSA